MLKHLILLFFFYLLSLSNTQKTQAVNFLPQTILSTLENEVDHIVLGIGETSVTYTETPENGESSIEFGVLPWVTNEEEWTFHLITYDGEVYSFVSQNNGEVDLVGPNGYDVNISQEYANSAEISVNEVADHFGDFIEFAVLLAVGAENGENAVDGIF